MTPLAAHLLFATAWLTFAAVHSLLAGESAKRRLRPRLGAFYRLVYNVVAVAHLSLVWLVGRWTLGGADPFALPPGARTAVDAIEVVGWLLLLVGLRGYDLGRLVGARQIRNRRRGIDEPEDEPLRLDGLHRYVRHPLYAGAMLILWGRAVDPFGVATAVWGTAYMLVGTWFEERKLLRLYGEAYAAYRRRVPAFLPWKGRAV